MFFSRINEWNGVLLLMGILMLSFRLGIVTM